MEPPAVSVQSTPEFVRSLDTVAFTIIGGLLETIEANLFVMDTLVVGIIVNKKE